MGVRKNSNTARLLALDVGERFYRDTTADNLGSDMTRALVPRSRRPRELDGREFEAQALTAVGTKVGDTRVLICITRIK